MIGVGEEIRVRGLVQGVGFRPTVWRHARDHGLVGDVRNDGEGVLIRVWGDVHAVESFVTSLRRDAPALARIEALERRPLAEPRVHDAFRIVPSAGGAAHTAVVPDAATCPACVAETLQPGSRRRGYPFTNCTHCGPRLSIVRAIPYDRRNTSLASFPMCPACRAEYEDPGDRRFHAQPIACPECGPRAWLEWSDGRPMVAGNEALDAARRLLMDGGIVAVKGLGGFHLACDATHAAAVARLRERKHRDRKPFALMAADTAIMARYCTIGTAERALLASTAAPIVLCDANGPLRLPDPVAPGVATLGFMLPYTPLHHLLLQGLDRPLVMTSGNRAETPQCIDDDDARTQLRDIADAMLLHDRDIVNRVDDSIVRVAAGGTRMLRRARGYAPAPVQLPRGFRGMPAVLAMGGELKNTFCLARDGEATLSQHQGDLEDARTFVDYRRNLELYGRLFDHDARVVAVDLHPDYVSTKLGHELAASAALDVVEVQHHHAHIASCLAENGVPLDTPPVLGIALDGLGMGERGELWGGEFLLADYHGFRRVARFKPVALLGGSRAMLEPWRNAYAHIDAAMGVARFRERYAGLALARLFERKPCERLDAMLRTGIGSPPASSCGRLFDAVAAAIGLCCASASYEAQPAMELEALAARVSEREAGFGYAFDLHDDGHGIATLDAAPMWLELLDDLSRDVAGAVVAARFTLGLADAVAATALRCAGRAGITAIALSGGVFQNRMFLERVIAGLQAADAVVLTHHAVPSGDGGLSLGQAAVAAATAASRRAAPCA